MDESPVDLGFLEEAQSHELQSHCFPSKVGGKPAWLELNNLPSQDELKCKMCEKPMIFLCQLYAPSDEEDDSFHRTLFVFTCLDGKCSIENESKNLRVFRSQLNRVNLFYSASGNQDSENGPSANDYGFICKMCGARGPKVCGACKKARYCSKEHQLTDWKSGHKAQCKTSDQTSSNDSLLFSEYELVMEPEELPETTEEENMKQCEQINEQTNGEQFSTQELAASAMVEKDKSFAKFQERVYHNKSQVIRYEKGGNPLWYTSGRIDNIPSCANCGSERQFEFQVMPQLLHCLKVHNDQTDHYLDWGILLIYTCKKSCNPINSGYMEEMIYRQG